MPEWTRALLRWYRRHGRDLPWRREVDPYRVWVSETMLQQTRVDVVVPYFERFVARFPNVAALAAASEEEVLASWSGLGYYRRARYLHRAARCVATELGGRFPDEVDGWRRLPGVGRYTAGAVVSIAFGRRAPVVDGNVERVLARIFFVRGDPRREPARSILWAKAAALLPRRRPGEWNQALMELGALVCLPRAPRCDACPVARHCAARRRGAAERLPERRRPKLVETATLGLAVVRRGRRVLLYRRVGTGQMEGLWELPHGECRAGEAPRDALAREARARYGLRVEPGRELVRVRHQILNRRLTLHAYASRLAGPLDARRLRAWVDPDARARVPMSSMTRKVLERLDDVDEGDDGASML